MPWRTCAFHCSSFLFATARELVPEDRFKGFPPTQSFMVQVRQTLSCPVFLSRYVSRKREPEPRSLIDGPAAAGLRRHGRGAAPARRGLRRGYIHRAGESAATAGALGSSSVELPSIASSPGWGSIVGIGPAVKQVSYPRTARGAA